MVDIFTPRHWRGHSRAIADYIDIGPDCWEWKGARNLTGLGYGRVQVAGRTAYAHRVVYEALVGLIPPGLTIDHLCRNPICVNPDHLEAVTQLVNNRRGGHALKTHCPQGHEYDEENTYLWRGRRKCRPCNRDNVRRFAARHKQD